MKKQILFFSFLREYSLLTFVLILVFIVPILPIGWHRHGYNICFTIIYFLAAFTIDKNKKVIMVFAFSVVLLEWISDYLGLKIINTISGISTVLFFILIVINFIIAIARSQRVTQKVIIEAINGYLLLGIVFSLLISLLYTSNPQAFNFEFETVSQSFGDKIYYSLVTMSTLGYGEIVPGTPVAKSLATFISVVGQFYLAILIATLVGKFSSQKKD